MADLLKKKVKGMPGNYEQYHKMLPKEREEHARHVRIKMMSNMSNAL
jgi:hypothetical protein